MEYRGRLFVSHFSFFFSGQDEGTADVWVSFSFWILHSGLDRYWLVRPLVLPPSPFPSLSLLSTLFKPKADLSCTLSFAQRPDLWVQTTRSPTAYGAPSLSPSPRGSKSDSMIMYKQQLLYQFLNPSNPRRTKGPKKGS